jgi:replicative DNA helicase
MSASAKPVLRDVSASEGKSARRDQPAPPHDLEAEAIVLSDVLCSHSVAQLRPVLEARDFFADVNGAIYQAALDLDDRGERIDSATVAALLIERTERGGFRIGGELDTPEALVRYVRQIEIATPFSAHMLAHARIVRGLAVRRRLVGELLALRAEAYGHVEDLEGWLDTVRTRIEAVCSEGRIEQEAPRLDQVMAAAFEQANRRPEERDPPPGIQVGIPPLDAVMIGGTAELTLLMGAPGGGKTSLAATIIANVMRNNAIDQADRYGASLFSFEMSEVQYERAITANVATINRAHLKDPDQLTPDERTRYAAAVETRSRLRYAVSMHCDPRKASIAYVRSQARADAARFKREGLRLKFVVVDYLQLVGANGEAGARANGEAELSHVARELKNLSYELDVPVFALSQQNADGDARGSRAIEMHAVNTWRIKLGKKEPMVPGVARGIEASLFIKKQREGEGLITVPLWYWPQYARFTE